MVIAIANGVEFEVKLVMVLPTRAPAKSRTTSATEVVTSALSRAIRA